MSNTTCRENSYKEYSNPSEIAARGFISAHAGLSRPFNLFPAVPTTPRREQLQFKVFSVAFSVE